MVVGGEIVIEVGLTAVVLVARPFFLCVRLHRARGVACGGRKSVR